MKKWAIIMAVAVFLVFFLKGPAASANENEDTVDGGDVVVTATLTDETSATATGTVIVITLDEITESGAATLAELLACYPGLWASLYGQDVGGLAVPSIRGTGAGQTLVMINGIPINSATNGTPNLNEVLLEDVERVEVMLGPASYLHGANALGGVINIVTRQPKDGFTYRVSAGAGGSGGWSLSYGKELEHGGVNVSTAQRYSLGSRDNADARDASIRAALVWHPAADLEIRANLGFQTAEYGLPGPVPAEGVIPEFGSAEATSLIDREHDRILSATVQVNWATGPEGFARLSVTGESRNLNYTTTYRDWISGDRINEVDIYDTTRLGAALAWQLDPFRGHRLTLGADARFDGLDAVMYQTPEGGSTIGTPWAANAWAMGAWANDAWSITDRFKLMTGARVDHSVYGTEVSPAMGLLVDISGNTRFRASLGKAYRVPTFNDLYWPTGGNPDLRPESGLSAETRLETARQRWFAGLGLFAWRTTDLIAWAPSEEGAWTPQNVNQAEALGVEGKAGVTFSKNLTLTVYGTWLSARQLNAEVTYVDPGTGETSTEIVERPLRSVPALSGGFELKWATENPGWQATVSGRYTGPRVNYYPDYSAYPTVGMLEKEIPGIFLLDLQVRRALSGWGWISLSLYNITGAIHDVQFGNDYYDRNFPGQGFRANVGLSIQY